MSGMNWDDPAVRARHIEAVGVGRYERDFAEHVARSTVAVVNGYSIRPVASRFGRLFMLHGAGIAFASLDRARVHALTLPPRREVIAPSPSASAPLAEIKGLSR